MSSARDNILAKLKAAQDKRGEIEMQIPDFASPIYHPLDKSLEQEFKKNLEAIGGRVIICSSKKEVAEMVKKICNEKNQNSVYCKNSELQELLESDIQIDSEDSDFLNINIGVTRCEFLVAHLGSVMISSVQISGRRLNVFPETHIVVAEQSQMVEYLDDAMNNMQKKYKNELPSLSSSITGPSRTADIEKTLVMGKHGPKSIIVIISEEPINN